MSVECVICKKTVPAWPTRQRKTCGQAGCQRKYRDVRVRNREHIRRATASDVTPEQEMAMRKRTRKCRLCGVYMTTEPNQPNSKHLDHILPISQGGTHTHGNVRIICATCNLKRPKDGSDFTGQLTLFAQEPGLVTRLSGHWNESRGTCRKGLHPWIPANIERNGSKRRCKLCREAYEQAIGRVLRQCKCGALFPAPGRTFMCPDCMDATARKAAELHASGLTWDRVAAEVGYESGTGAMDAAKRVGYRPPPGLAAVKARARAIPKPPRLCLDCGTPKRGGKCEPCTTAKAWRAVEMYRGGATLEEIGSHVGYNSKTGVSNLMKSVTAMDMRIGRPCL